MQIMKPSLKYSDDSTLLRSFTSMPVTKPPTKQDVQLISICLSHNFQQNKMYSLHLYAYHRMTDKAKCCTVCMANMKVSGQVKYSV